MDDFGGRNNLYNNKCLPGKFWKPVYGFGRAIARWNRLGIKLIDLCEIFASRAPRARSARKCVFSLHKPPYNGCFETWTIKIN